MAHRRRTFSSCYGSSASFLTVSVCFKERTSFDIPNFAQSRRRRFTGSKSGVSFFASDAEPSDTKSNEESMVLVAREPGSPQIWRARPPTSAFLLLFVDRDRFSVYNRRSFPYQSCFSGFHILIPHQQPSSTASATWFICRSSLHPHAAGLNLGFQVLCQFWIMQLTGRFLFMGSMGLMFQKPMPFAPQPITSSVLNLCRCGRRSPIAILTCFTSHINLCLCRRRYPIASLNCFISHLIAFQGLYSASPIDWVGPLSLVTATYSLLHWSFVAEYLFRHVSPELPRYQNSSCRGQREIACPPPRYQNSSCRGQREIVCPPPRYQNSSCRGQREIAFPILLLEGENFSIIILIFLALVCRACVARSDLELKGDSSETLLSDIFKGSAMVAVSMIVVSVLVAGSIANNSSLLVLFVPQGIVSLVVLKLSRFEDSMTFYGLSVKIACNYLFIFHVCVFRLPFEAAMALLFSDVTNSSFYGE